MSRAVLKAIAVTCELTSTNLSEAAIRLMVDSLSEYPETQVLGALRKCCKELRSRLTLADILTRIEDGRPGAEVAWAMLSTILGNEQASLVWTEEMREAYGVVAPLADDPVAARMAFKEQYTALISQAKRSTRARQVDGQLGLRPDATGGAVVEAVERKRLTQEQAHELCPSLQPVCKETLKFLEGSSIGIQRIEVVK